MCSFNNAESLERRNEHKKKTATESEKYRKKRQQKRIEISTTHEEQQQHKKRHRTTMIQVGAMVKRRRRSRNEKKSDGRIYPNSNVINFYIGQHTHMRRRSERRALSVYHQADAFSVRSMKTGLLAVFWRSAEISFLIPLDRLECVDLLSLSLPNGYLRGGSAGEIGVLLFPSILFFYFISGNCSLH